MLLSGRLKSVVPFVEDRRNVLIFDPQGAEVTPAFTATLESALKVAIQSEYDLEDSELAEPLEQLRVIGRRTRHGVELFHRLAEDGGVYH